MIQYILNIDCDDDCDVEYNGKKSSWWNLIVEGNTWQEVKQNRDAFLKECKAVPRYVDEYAKIMNVLIDNALNNNKEADWGLGGNLHISFKRVPAKGEQVVNGVYHVSWSGK